MESPEIITMELGNDELPPVSGRLHGQEFTVKLARDYKSAGFILIHFERKRNVLRRIDMVGPIVRRALAIILVITLTTISIGTFAVTAAAVEGCFSGRHGLGLGDNNYGELGNGTNTESDIPVQVSLPSLPGGVTITNIASGDWYSLALASNGTVWAWGDNTYGELGNGKIPTVILPVQVSLPSGMVTITNIAAGSELSLALASNGTVWAWGDNALWRTGQRDILPTVTFRCRSACPAG